MQFGQLKRREFITLLGGTAAWPLIAHAQERVRRVGVLMSTTPDEPESQARITALAQGLQETGWAIGRNIRIEVRWSGGDYARVRKDAEELVALAPDVLVAGIGPTTAALQEFTHTVPIVFTQAVDPVGLSTVKSMARPGGNATGFLQFEYGLSAKWLELLNSAGDRGSTVPPRSASRALSLGSARPALISLLRRPMISGGVFLGTPMPSVRLDS
jgi:putative ABC transport system substrate-binding protein